MRFLQRLQDTFSCRFLSGVVRCLCVGIVLLFTCCVVGCERDVAPTAEDQRLGEAAFAAAAALIHAHPSRVAAKDSQAVSAYLQQQLTHPTRTAQCDAFSAPQGTMVNVLYSAPQGVQPKALLVSHYDTKVGIEGFVGANDGASTTGLLIAIANLTDWPVMCLLVDGEECVEDYSAADGLHGSWHAAKQEVGKGLPVIVLDMLGDRDYTPTLSENGSTRLKAQIRAAAKKAGIALEEGDEIIDDHVPFQAYKRNVANIIDFTYGPENVYWHTADDTLENICAASLTKTAMLVRYILNEL